MSKKWFRVVVGLMLVSGISGIVYGQVQRSRSNGLELVSTTGRRTAVAQAPDASQSSGQVAGESTTSTSLAVGNTNTSGTSLQSQGTGQQTIPLDNQPSATTSQSNQSAASGVAAFKEYDKYINDQNGLYGDLQVGDGAEAVTGSKLKVLYRGWLTNGQVFDESRPDANGAYQPFEFTLGAHQVIPGWEQTIAGMKVGGVRRLIIPPAVGYGEQGQGAIPPNSVLVFEVQLQSVE